MIRKKAVIRVSCFVKTSEFALACAARQAIAVSRAGSRLACISHHPTAEAREKKAVTRDS